MTSHLLSKKKDSTANFLSHNLGNSTYLDMYHT